MTVLEIYLICISLLSADKGDEDAASKSWSLSNLTPIYSESADSRQIPGDSKTTIDLFNYYLNPWIHVGA